MSAPIAKWICSELSHLLGFHATDDIANYILAIADPKDLEDYLCDLLDASIPKNRQFIDELLRKWRPRGAAVGDQNNIKVYQKAADSETYFTGTADKQGKTKKKGKKAAQSHPSEAPPSVNNGLTHGQGSAPSPPRGQHKTSPADAKKKTKYISLFTETGADRTAAILPGRHKCECQAAKHTLISNCVQCGRVVCEQEGSGPCLFCGALVCTKEEQSLINRGTKRSDKFRQYLMKQEEAIAHKDKLLNYDRTSMKRTQVIDDESDYFSTDTNQWLSTTDREALRQREDELRNMRHASRKDRKITLDFAGRRVIEEKEVVNMYNINDTVVQKVHYGKDTDQRQEEPMFTEDDFGDLVNPLIMQTPPQFVDTSSAHSKKSSHTSSKPAASRSGEQAADVRLNNLRIQDDQLQKMSDEGACLSMHQPWASLLTTGIKKHEGRSWYSAHRGRLWIASTAKQATQDDIEELEESYRRLYNDQSLKFPKDYPDGCLLGCVDVTDVLDSDTYTQQFPEGESASPYVFICENPQELVVKFPMKGKHKIYKLETHLHKAAKSGLKKS